MTDQNPFMAPRSDKDLRHAEGSDGAYSDGQHLITASMGAVLPDLCVRCGQPADTHVQGKFQFIPMWARMLILLGPLPYLIAFFFVRKRAEVSVGMCDAHKSQLTLMKSVGIGGLVLGLIMILGGLFLVEVAGPEIMLAGLLVGLIVLIGGAVTMTVGGMPLKVVRITNEEAVFKAVHPSVMDLL